MRTTTRLRQMLKEPGIIVAPGAYDGFSARLIEAAGFRCVYMTGAGTAASHIGQPDLGLTTMTEMATNAGHIPARVSLPVIADADTGYGNALHAVGTRREYERAGGAGCPLRAPVGGAVPSPPWRRPSRASRTRARISTTAPPSLPSTSSRRSASTGGTTSRRNTRHEGDHEASRAPLHGQDAVRSRLLQRAQR